MQGFAVRASPAAVYLSHPTARQSPAREPVEICLPTSPGIRPEICGSPGVLFHKPLSDIVANLERRLRDGRSEPGLELAGIAGHCGDRFFENAIREAAPAGMRHRDGPAGARSKYHRKAIRRQDGADHARQIGVHRVRLGFRQGRTVCDGCPVHLAKPARFSGQIAGIAKQLAVACNRIRIVADMRSEI